MFANQILKTLSHSSHKKGLPSDHNSKIYFDQIDEAIKTIRRSPQFYLGSYKNIQNSVMNKLENEAPFDGRFGDVILPYPEFVVCYTDVTNNLKVANIIKPFKGSSDIISFEILMSMYNDWVMIPLIKIISIGKNLNETDLYRGNNIEDVDFKASADETNIAMVATAEAGFKHLNDETYMQIQTEMTAIVNYFLLALKYKNVIIETVRKTKSKLLRKKKNRVFDYKILKVKLPKSYTKYDYDENTRKTKGVIPFSSVMTHEKTYTEDSPLFGKHVGTWIWHNFMKGDKKKGFITKDYAVELS